ncbi:MAG: hypothetical protein ABSG76_11565 [Xanthobacteraceae bacterium]
MRTLFALLITAGCVAACAGVQPDRQREQMAELRRQIETEKQDCDNVHPRDARGPQAFSHRARCLNDVETRLVRPVAPFPDLLDQRLAARKALATELDAGRISEAEANVRWAAQDSAIEERRRGEYTGSIPADATGRLTQQRAMLRATCAEVDARVSCF